MKREAGFTLLELLIALMLFSLLALGCWRLFDGLLRAERQSNAHAQQLRDLQRALAVIERDLLQAMPARGVHVSAGLLNLQRLNWRNPLDLPRSEWQEVSYRLQDQRLWRHSRGDGGPQQRQALLSNVEDVQWRVLDQHGIWHVGGGAVRQPRAVELSITHPRFDSVRRLFMLAEGRR